MLKDGATFEETLERLKAVRVMKDKLATAPVIVVPNWERDFHVFIDTSGFCIGLVLSQLDDKGKDHPIYYASKHLSLPERAYTTTKGEALGVVYSCKKFRHYFLGYKVIFHTDHGSLKHIVKKADVRGRIAPWILLLQEFNYEVKVKPGKMHANADLFSPLREVLEEQSIEDRFPDEELFKVELQSIWYVDIFNYIQEARLPPNLSKKTDYCILKEGI